MSNTGKCAICQQQKHYLSVKESRLWQDKKFLACKSCIDNEYEPRWLIVLVAMQDGLDAVKFYVENHKYVGKEITLAEML